MFVTKRPKSMGFSMKENNSKKTVKEARNE